MYVYKNGQMVRNCIRITSLIGSPKTILLFFFFFSRGMQNWNDKIVTVYARYSNYTPMHRDREPVWLPCRAGTNRTLETHCRSFSENSWDGPEKENILHLSCTQDLQLFHRPQKPYFGTSFKCGNLPLVREKIKKIFFSLFHVPVRISKSKEFVTCV